MAKKRRNNKRRNGNSVSAAGIVYLIKNLGGVVMKQSGVGHPISLAQAGDYGKAALAVYNNAKDMNLTDIVVDGVKLGLVRRTGLGVNIMRVGNTNIRSV